MRDLFQSNGIHLIAVPSRRYPLFLLSALKLLKAVDADLIYALKPYPTSFGLGLLYHWAKGVPLVLDIDDWELGAFRAMDRGRLWRTIMAGIASPNNYFWLRLLYRRTALADAITVSSVFLQKRYGGILVPHGRDTVAMDPARTDRDQIRRELGAEGKVVMFLGTPRPPKGVEDLVSAVNLLARRDVRCTIVGIEDNDPYCMHLCTLASDQVQLLPMQPFDKVAAFLAAADVVAVPQRRTPFAEAQVPAKLFDAMAMARPIVSTAVSDIPKILEGCGVVVPPGDVNALAGAIAYLLDNPLEAQRLGTAAREKCVNEFSWDAMQVSLQQVLDRVAVTQETHR